MRPRPPGVVFELRARRLLGEKLWGAFFWGVACGAALAVVLLLTFRGAGCD